MYIKRRLTDRRGATAVEFAIVAPVLLGFIFLIIELSRMMLFSGNVNSAMLIGLRNLTLSDSNAAEVELVIRTELRRYGITVATIEFDPADFDAGDQQVELSVAVPASKENGLGLARLSYGGTNVVRRSINVDRESR